MRKRSFFRLHLHPNELMEADQYRELVDDICAFNQTMFWFVDRFLMALKKLDSENFAAALFDFYSPPGAEKMIANPLRNSIRHIYRFNDPAMITFAPCEVKPGRYAIYELVTAQSLQSLRNWISKERLASEMDAKKAYLENQGFIEACARKLCGTFHCEHLLEDLVSVGTLAFLEHLPDYDETAGAKLTTYLYPFINGDMRAGN